MFSTKKGFLLKFSENQSWYFLPVEEELTFFLNKFASIIGIENSLSPISNSSIIFVSNQLDEIKFKELIQKTNLAKEVNHSYPIQKICQSSLLEIWLYQDNNPHRFYGINLNRFSPNSKNEENFDIGRMRSISIPILVELQKNNGLPLHSAFIKRHETGILLAAPSKTGKTTCCCRIPPSWTVLSDDTTLITYDEKQYRAHPFPTWSKFLPAELRTKRSFEHHQKRWDIKQNANLNLILFLEQAENDEIIPLNQTESAIRIYQSSIQSNYLMSVNKNKNNDIEYITSDKAKIPLKQELFKNSCKLAKSVKTFVLRASLNGSFWKQIEKVL